MSSIVWHYDNKDPDNNKYMSNEYQYNDFIEQGIEESLVFGDIREKVKLGLLDNEHPNFEEDDYSIVARYVDFSDSVYKFTKFSDVVRMYAKDYEGYFILELSYNTETKLFNMQVAENNQSYKTTRTITTLDYMDNILGVTNITK